MEQGAKLGSDFFCSNLRHLLIYNVQGRTNTGQLKLREIILFTLLSSVFNNMTVLVTITYQQWPKLICSSLAPIHTLITLIKIPHQEQPINSVQSGGD